MWTVSYERISEDKSGEAAGVERQRSDNCLLAQAKGQTVDRFYRDNSVSALDESKIRDEFEKLVDDVTAGRVGTIVVWHLDRLAVRVTDLARLLNAAKPYQVQIAAVHGVSIDLADPTGVAVATILVAIAEMERRHKGIRQRAANRQRAERGKVGWTRRPYGYDRIDGEVFVVPEERDEFLRMVDAALAGRTLASIAADLNERGVVNSLGRSWSIVTVKRVLLNPRYAGRAVSNGMDHGIGDWPAIIDEATHERLTHVLRDPRRQTAHSTEAKHLLSGLLLCGRCGAKMFASPYNGRRGSYMIYRCGSGKGHLARKLDPVDEVVTEVILSRLERPDAARLLEPDVDLDALRARAVDLRSRRDAVAAMVADGLASTDAGREQASKLAADLTDVERDIDAATGSGPLAELAASGDVRETWESLNLAGKRAAIDTLVIITIHPQGKGVPFDAGALVDSIEWKTE